MASNPTFVTYALDQMGRGIEAKKMFGEYGVYKNGVMFALICDDTVFLKNTDAARQRLGTVKEGLPYPGAKPWIVIDPEDGDTLRELIDLTLSVLPKAQPKKARKPSTKANKVAAKTTAAKKTPVNKASAKKTPAKKTPAKKPARRKT